VELDLSKWKGMRPVELVGHTAFPAIGDLPYLLTLSGHAFYWFSIEPPPGAEEQARADAYVPPVLTGRSVASLLLGEEQVALEDALPGFLAPRRWFGGRAFRITGTRIIEAVAFGGVYVLIVRTDYADHETERYVVPVAVAGEGRVPAAHAMLAVLRVPGLPGGEAPLVDAMEDGASARALLEAVRVRIRALGARGRGAGAGPPGPAPTPPAPRPASRRRPSSISTSPTETPPPQAPTTPRPPSAT